MVDVATVPHQRLWRPNCLAPDSGVRQALDAARHAMRQNRETRHLFRESEAGGGLKSGRRSYFKWHAGS